MESNKRKVLFLAPYCNGGDVGEQFNSHRWAKALSSRIDLTVLSLHRRGQVPLAEQLPGVKVVTWKDSDWFAKFERFDSIAKPSYIKYYYLARQWIKSELKKGADFDLIHQMTPAALRYPSPGAGLGLPLVHGPMQGGIETPLGMRSECKEGSAWYMKLRQLDRLRIKYDPLLRGSLQKSDLILVGSNYVRSLLHPIKIKNIAELVHLNIDGLVRHPERKLDLTRGIELLYVGRIIRTKGLLDAIRALGMLEGFNFKLHVVGEGDNYPQCEAALKELNLEEKIVFHGKQPRHKVEEFYGKCDLFLFPSFREPAGGVVLEAMRHGLPVITTTIGGPGYYVNQSCGITVEVNSPEQLAKALAQAINEIASKPELYTRLSEGAYQRAEELGNFDKKLDWLLQQYENLIRTQHGRDSESALSDRLS